MKENNKSVSACVCEKAKKEWNAHETEEEMRKRGRERASERVREGGTERIQSISNLVIRAYVDSLF